MAKRSKQRTSGAAQPWSREATTGPTATPAQTSIRALDAAEAQARLGELSDILVDAVALGASVNFMAGFSTAEGPAFSLLPRSWTSTLQVRG